MYNSYVPARLLNKLNQSVTVSFIGINLTLLRGNTENHGIKVYIKIEAMVVGLHL